MQTIFEQNQQTSNTSSFEVRPLTSLLERIYRSSEIQKRKQRLKNLKFKLWFLLFIVYLLCFLKCHIRIYNAWMGPFMLSRDSFFERCMIYAGDIDIERSLLFGLLSLEEELLQIELDEDQIDDSQQASYFVHFRHPIYNRPLYAFHPVKAFSSVVSTRSLFVKLPTHFISHFHKRLPYRFGAFKTSTLTCIVRHLNVFIDIRNDALVKSTYVKRIEEIYDRNATDFNMKVIKQCGIFIGYLYDFEKATVFSSATNVPYSIHPSALVFDASSSYSPYASYVLCSVLLLWIVFNLAQYLLHYLRVEHDAFIRLNFDVIKSQLQQYNIQSIGDFDYVLMTTTQDNNYGNELFIIKDQYLVIFKINLNEHNPDILYRFHKTELFTIINVQTIKNISPYFISIVQEDRQVIIPCEMSYNTTSDEAQTWLHQRLMNYSTRYRANYEDEQRRIAEELIRREREERLHRLSLLIKEEERFQELNQVTSFEQMWDRVPPASARFIAEFRMDPSNIIINTGELSKENCCICQEEFQFDEKYSQWPCPGKHVYHYQCMLDLLRKQNRCAQCRMEVEAGILQPPAVVWRNTLTTAALRVLD